MAKPSPDQNPPARVPRRDWLWGLGLIVAILLAYQPVWFAGFIWDDDGRITANPCIVGPLGLKEIWTTAAADLCPLVYTSFWVEHALWGLAPLPYHLVNLLLHAACAVLLWQVLRSLKIPGAWLGAALWALHPVQVETAAWITEMKNTQSGFFYLLTILFYIRSVKATALADRRRDRWNYTLTLLCAALAMASKSSTVILPLVLALAAWWVEGRWHWRHAVRLAPLALFAIFPSLLTLWTQTQLEQGPGDLQYARPFAERLATAGDAIWFYLGKLAWPHPLIFIFPRWQVDSTSWISYLPLLTVVVVLFILWWKRATWARPYFFTFAYFVAALLPVLGLIDGFFWRYSLVGDHFQYLASMGPLALIGAGLTTLTHGKGWLRPALGSALLLIFSVMSWNRCWTFTNIEALWSDTVAQNPHAWIARNNLGDAYSRQGRVDEALLQFRLALALKPNDAEAMNNIGNALLQRGKVDAAMDLLQKALAIDPQNAEAHNNLGNALLQTNRPDEAAAQYRAALQLNPFLAEVQGNLGNAFLRQGQVDAAIAQYQTALGMKANNADARNGLGSALLQKGRVDDAIAQLQIALQLNPNLAEAHNNLGSALLQKGAVRDAIAQLQAALQINPRLAEAHYYLGNALLQTERFDEAIGQYQQALEIRPAYAEAHNNRGSALAQTGRLDQAIIEFQSALAIKPDYLEAQKNLVTAREMARQNPKSK